MSDGTSWGTEPFPVGSQVAGYRLDAMIGRGGMAVVYRAHDPRLDRRVALKILAPGLASDESFRQRFIRESRAAAAVNHPHIIPVFEAGQAGQVLFIAMRYVESRDVRTLLDQQGPLPVARVASIITQVASALDAAHDHGLVHRDVEPANMLLDASAGDGPDHVYLSDFGLSKQALSSSGITGTGQFLGTLDYVAPEQIQGRPVDGRADEYALACAAVEMLTGTPPFPREENLAVMWAQMSEPPPSLTERRPGLPPAVDQVIATALAKSPSDRYQRCGEFAAALREACGLPAPRGESPPPGQTPPHPPTQVARPAAAAAGPGGPPTEAAVPSRPGLPPPPGPPAAGGAAHLRRRPWWRSPAAVAAAVVVVLGAAGGAYALTRGGGGGGSSHGGSGGGGGTAGLSMPGCTNAIAAARPLNSVRTSAAQLSGQPFGVVVTGDGKWSFVSQGNSIAVLGNGSALAPSPVRTIPVPGDAPGRGDHPRRALPARRVRQRGDRARRGHGGAGRPEPGHRDALGAGRQGGSRGAVSADGRLAFVTLQFSNTLAVFNLQAALSRGFGRPDLIGTVPLGVHPVGMNISRDGRWLYVVSQQRSNSSQQGMLNVISVQKAGVRPASSVVAQVPAGCHPVRVVTSGHGSQVWVSVRESNAVLCFSASKLRSDPGHALIARVQVGQSPIGVAPVDGGARIVVANSNLAGRRGVAASLAVINASAALDGKPALVGLIRSGSLPRQFALEPDGRTLLVTNSSARQLEAVDVTNLP